MGALNENSALMKMPPSEESRMAEVVTKFMKAVDHPENISEEEVSAIAATKLEVCLFTINTNNSIQYFQTKRAHFKVK